MRISATIFIFCVMVMVVPAHAQIRIVPREKIEAVANPRLSSDSSALRFDTEHIVAATMSEDDPPAVFRFEMTNAGAESIAIHRVNTTCSCVTVSCPIKSLDPGEHATLTVRYDPKGHPGRFERKIFIYTGPGDNPAAVLRISAHVERSSDMSRLYQVQMGSIRLRSKEIGFVKGVKAVESLKFLNLSGSDMKLECEEMFLPDCVSFRTEPAVLGDGEEGTLIVTYDPAMGECRDSVPLILKGLGVPPGQSTIKIKFE